MKFVRGLEFVGFILKQVWFKQQILCQTAMLTVPRRCGRILLAMWPGEDHPNA